MIHLRKYLFMTALLVINTQVSTESLDTPSVKQSDFSLSRCQSSGDCLDYFPKWWARYQKACCEGKNGPMYHCQQSYVEGDGGHTNISVACVYPVTCEAGTYAYVKTWFAGGVKLGAIECRSCTHDRFQSDPQESYKFRYANCSEVWQKCLQEEGSTMVKPGNATHNNLCRCMWERGYGPAWNTTKCRSLEGFPPDDCTCLPYTCPDGQTLNKDFVCVKQTSTTTTSTTTTSPPTTTPTTGTNHANGAPITAAIDFLSALTMSAAIIIFI